MQRRDLVLRGALPMLVAGAATGRSATTDKPSSKENCSWRFTPAVDSMWAGVVQIKWCSARGVAFHTTGGRPVQDWCHVLSAITWAPIDPKNVVVPTVELPERFIVLPHIVFGKENPETQQNHGVFMIDTCNGVTYVLAVHRDGKSCYPSHDNFDNCFWHKITEPTNVSEIKDTVTGRFQLSVVNSAEKPLSDGNLGPYVTRIDSANGQVDVAIPKKVIQRTPGALVNDVDFVWHSTSSASSSCP